MSRKKCVLRACPHHHFALDKIAGTPVKPLSFPITRQKRGPWVDFVHKYNGTVMEPTRRTFLCSAHFTPESFNEGKLKPFAVPTIDPEEVRKLAIENGDMRPVTLDTSVTIEPGEVLDCPSIVYLKEEKNNSPVCGSERTGKRKHLGDLCMCDFKSRNSVKVALQLVNSTLLKVWSGGGLASKVPGNSKVVGGKELEIVEKCLGDCYNHGMKDNLNNSTEQL